MSVFRYKGSKVWTMDFEFHGQRIRGVQELAPRLWQERSRISDGANWKKAQRVSESVDYPIYSPSRLMHGWR
jgi:hypothetical protein